MKELRMPICGARWDTEGSGGREREGGGLGLLFAAASTVHGFISDMVRDNRGGGGEDEDADDVEAYIVSGYVVGYYLMFVILLQCVSGRGRRGGGGVGEGMGGGGGVGEGMGGAVGKAWSSSPKPSPLRSSLPSPQGNGAGSSVPALDGAGGGGGGALAFALKRRASFSVSFSCFPLIDDTAGNLARHADPLGEGLGALKKDLKRTMRRVEKLIAQDLEQVRRSNDFIFQARTKYAEETDGIFVDVLQIHRRTKNRKSSELAPDHPDLEAVDKTLEVNRPDQ